MGTQQVCYGIDLDFDILTAMAMHHGKQVIGPQRQVPRPLVTVAHVIQRTDLTTEFNDAVIGDIPHRHAVGRVTQGIMIRYGGNAPNDTTADKVLEAAKHYGIPIVRNVPLAQALDKLEVGAEIPEELYEAVAEVLNFVYALSDKHKQR